MVVLSGETARSCYWVSLGCGGSIAELGALCLDGSLPFHGPVIDAGSLNGSGALRLSGSLAFIGALWTYVSLGPGGALLQRGSLS
jgi:hypothetical protein